MAWLDQPLQAGPCVAVLFVVFCVGWYSLTLLADAAPSFSCAGLFLVFQSGGVGVMSDGWRCLIRKCWSLSTLALSLSSFPQTAREIYWYSCAAIGPSYSNVEFCGELESAPPHVAEARAADPLRKRSGETISLFLLCCCMSRSRLEIFGHALAG